jgi:hypothetical protein
MTAPKRTPVRTAQLPFALSAIATGGHSEILDTQQSKGYGLDIPATTIDGPHQSWFSIPLKPKINVTARLSWLP